MILAAFVYEFIFAKDKGVVIKTVKLSVSEQKYHEKCFNNNNRV